MSQRIKVQPDRLRQSAQQLRQASSKLHDIGSRVGNAYNRMDAEARSAAGVGGRVRQAQSRAAALAQEAMRLATYLETKANALEQADRAGFDGLRGIASSIEALQGSSQQFPQLFPDAAQRQLLLGSLFATGSMVMGGFTTVMQWMVDHSKDRTSIIEGTKGIIDIKGAIKDLSLLKELDFSKGSAYVNEVIIRGSREAKEALFLKPGTTHIKSITGFAEQLSPGISNQLFRGVGKVTTGAAITTMIFTAIGKGFENYETYKDDKQAWQKTTAATTLDTVVTTACVAGGTALVATAGGALLGGALGAATGGILAPLGVSIGIQVGGVLGGMAGQWAADNIMKSDLYKENKERFVQWGADQIDRGVAMANDAAKDLSEGVDQVGASINDAAQDLARGTQQQLQSVQESARKVDNAIKGATSGLLHFFGA